jgi:aminopeptidase N
MKIEAAQRLTAAEDEKLVDRLESAIATMGNTHANMEELVTSMDSDFDTLERFDANFFQDASDKKLVKALPKVEAAITSLKEAIKVLKSTKKVVDTAIKALDSSV